MKNFAPTWKFCYFSIFFNIQYSSEMTNGKTTCKSLTENAFHVDGVTNDVTARRQSLPTIFLKLCICFVTLITSAMSSVWRQILPAISDCFFHLFLCLSGWKITHNSQTHWHLFTKFGTHMHLGLVQNTIDFQTDQTQLLKYKFWQVCTSPPSLFSYVCSDDVKSNANCWDWFLHNVMYFLCPWSHNLLPDGTKPSSGPVSVDVEGKPT